jgi:metalloendopeptidase OMA1, mitochondrial
MSQRRTHWPLILAICVAVQACAGDPVVQTPPKMKVITKEDPVIGAIGGASESHAERLADVRRLEPVVRVVTRLIAAARKSDFGTRARTLCWVVAVYDNDARARSFVWPDGSIVVYSGTFRLAETEAGLAAVLSHELVQALVRDEVPVPPSCVSPTRQEPALFSHKEEQQADERGLILMADAGYDPRELLALWERMRRQQDHVGDEVLAHFTYDRRMEHLAQWLPHALMRYERANRAPQRVLPLK